MTRTAPREFDTGALAIEVFENNVPPRFRVRSAGCALPTCSDLSIETVRPDGSRQLFAFEDRGGFLELRDEIPEPHAFMATGCAMQAGQPQTRELLFEEHEHGQARITATTTCGPPSSM